MRKVLLTIIAIAAVSFGVKADPAKKVNLSYENDSLKIETIHKVRNVTKHYIDLITIKADGKVIKTIKPEKQSSLKSEVVEVSLPGLSKGTKIEVTTRCNEFGKKSATLVL
jgi:dissimilatory sulfite reductase (desulfoviridin) alpha/beta subunit